MAVLYVTEYANIAVLQGGRTAQIPMEPPLVEQAIAITASSTTTAAFNAQTAIVRVHTDVICGITFGTAPVAIVSTGTLGSERMVAGQTEYSAVPLGKSFKIAVIATT